MSNNNQNTPLHKLLIDVDTLGKVMRGQAAISSKVGTLFINDGDDADPANKKTHAIFLATDRNTNQIRRSTNGQVIFNVRPQMDEAERAAKQQAASLGQLLGALGGQVQGQTDVMSLLAKLAGSAGTQAAAPAPQPANPLAQLAALLAGQRTQAAAPAPAPAAADPMQTLMAALQGAQGAQGAAAPRTEAPVTSDPFGLDTNDDIPF